MIRDDLRTALEQALHTAGLPEPPDGVALDPARSRDHGDWATNVALKLAKGAGAPPMEVAQRIATALEAGQVPHLAKVEVAKPGFVNLFLAPSWLTDVLRIVVKDDAHYG